MTVRQAAQCLAAIAFMGAISLGACSSSHEARRIATKLQVYQPIVVELDGVIVPPVQPLEGKFADLVVTPLVRGGEPVAPRSFYDAVDEFRSLVPKEYYEAIIREYGYVKDENEVLEPLVSDPDLDLRKYDLRSFLTSIWDLYTRQDRLGREFRCMGGDPIDLTSFFVTVAERETLREGSTRIDKGELRNLTYNLRLICLPTPHHPEYKVRTSAD